HFTTDPPTRLPQVNSNAWVPLAYPVPPSVKRWLRGTEYQPVIHRLRLSASAYVPTNAEQTSFTQETLGVRWTCFPHVFRYSSQHSHFPCLHGSLVAAASV